MTIAPESIPDTLDLADRAGLALNGLLGALDPEHDYDPYFLMFYLANPPYLLHWSGMYSGILPKFVEAIPLMRLMSGSQQGKDLEQGMFEAIFSNIAHDGLLYDEERPERPWNTGIGYGVKSWHEDYANLAGNGRLLLGFANYHAVTGDPIWLERMQRTAHRMMDLAIRKEDYAYYPNVGLGNDFSYPKHSGWVHTKEPTHGREGQEGSTTFYLALPMRGLMRWYQISGDERALDISRGLKTLIVRPQFWGGYSELDPEVGAARAHFWGHYHGNTATLRALLEYAVVTDDWQLKQFVRDGYEYARQHAVPQLGLFPGADGLTEGCTIADMTELAIQLSDAGVGDYWDDVDAIVRNGLIEVQTADKDELARVQALGPERPTDAPWGAVSEWRFAMGIQRSSLPGQECTDRVLERALGAFGALDGPYFQHPLQMHCCTPNCSLALYSAWEAILRQRDGVVEVNLWLNRRSPWVDVESALPHAGQVTVRNKTARRLSVRIPGWVKQGAVQCRLDDVPIEPAFLGRSVVFESLRPGQVVTITVSVNTETVSLVPAELNGRGHIRGAVPRWTARFRGATAVHIEGPGEDPGGRDRDRYRTFRREDLASETIPTRTRDGYVAPQAIRW